MDMEQLEIVEGGAPADASAIRRRKSRMDRVKSMFPILEKLSGENGWRFILGLTLYPFIIVGCPVFLIFDAEGPLKYKRWKERSEETEFWKRTPIPKGTIPWLRFVWTNERYRLAASANSSLHNYLYWIGLVVTSILALIMNSLLIYEMGEIIYYVFYLGVLSKEILTALKYSILLLPTIILIDYVWLFGYQLKATVESFDARVILEELDDFHASGSNLPVKKLKTDKAAPSGNLKNRPTASNESCSNRQIGMGEEDLEGCETDDSKANLDNTSGKKLAVIYLLVVIIHVSRSLLIWHEKTHYATAAMDYLETPEFWDFVAIVSYTLGCPVYCCFCWGIRYQTASLIIYIDNMNLAGVGMNELHLCTIKQAFKIIVRNVTHLNYLFRMYLPALSLAFGVTVVSYGAAFFAKPIPVVVLHALDSITKTISAGEEESSTRLQVTSPGDNSSEPSVIELLPPEVVRYGMGQVVNLGLNVGLVILTLQQASLTNNYIRYIQVKLNDFASGSYPHSNPCSPSVFQTFKLVKTYIHSRLEPGQRRQGLLIAPSIADFIPILKTIMIEKRLKIWH